MVSTIKGENTKTTFGEIFYLLFIFFLLLFLIYYFFVPPRIINISQKIDRGNLASVGKIVIEFDKPIERKELSPTIFPDVAGEWRFEKPMTKNHLFQSLAFVPKVAMDPKVQYVINLDNTKSYFNVGFSENYSFSFKPTIELAESAESQKITLIDIKNDWQDQKLSCEAASLKMALSSKGIYVTEGEIMDRIGFDSSKRQGPVWGNPYEHFVGSLNGRMCSTGYGVYWQPVASAANNWRDAEYFSNGDIKKVVDEISAGNPIVMWGTLPVDSLTNCSWYTSDGQYVKAYKEDHVRLIIGFMGEPENPTKIVMNDPISGRLYWDTNFFLNNWKAFDYSGVVVK